MASVDGWVSHMKLVYHFLAHESNLLGCGKRCTKIINDFPSKLEMTAEGNEKLISTIFFLRWARSFRCVTLTCARAQTHRHGSWRISRGARERIDFIILVFCWLTASKNYAIKAINEFNKIKITTVYRKTKNQNLIEITMDFYCI